MTLKKENIIFAERKQESDDRGSNVSSQKPSNVSSQRRQGTGISIISADRVSSGKGIPSGKGPIVAFPITSGSGSGRPAPKVVGVQFVPQNSRENGSKLLTVVPNQGLRKTQGNLQENGRLERAQAQNHDFDVSNNNDRNNDHNNGHFMPTGSMLFSAQPKRNQELIQKTLYFPESISSIKPEEQSRISMSNMNMLRSNTLQQSALKTQSAKHGIESDHTLGFMQSNARSAKHSKQSYKQGSKRSKGLSFFAKANSLRQDFLNDEKKSVEKASQENGVNPGYVQAFRYNERVVHSPDSESPSSQTLSDLEGLVAGKGGTNVRNNTITVLAFVAPDPSFDGRSSSTVCS
jgi:hypothetical protein